MAAFSTDLSAPVSASSHHAPVFRRIAEALQARRVHRQTVTTYRELLCADDHFLHDLGVTRDDIRQLLDEIAPRP